MRCSCRILTTLCLAAVAAPSIARPAVEVEGVLEAALDPGVRRDLQERRRVVIEDFPLPGSPAVDLQLTAFDLLTPRARLVVVDETGERGVPRPSVRFFRGHATGHPESTVTLGLSDAGLRGSIRLDKREFVIEAPEPGSIRVRDRGVDPDRPDRPFCSRDLPQGDGLAPRSTRTIDENTLLTARIAIDAPYEWFAHFGTLTAAQDYILVLMAQVSTIYHNEVNVELEVPYLRVFTVADDPYSATTDPGTLLSELRAEWNANQTEVDRTVVHLISVRPGGGSGIAYLNSLCSNAVRPGSSFDYGVTTISARGGAWEKELVAHELGHNFSSPHTHCYVPEIDQCANEDGCYSGPTVATTGTIMSYCSSSLPEFHARVEAERIRPAAEAAYPTCISSAGDPPDAPLGLRVE